MATNSTFVFAKDTLTDTEVGFDITSLLRFGETLTSIVIQPVTPATTPPLVLNRQSATDNPAVVVLATGGVPNISYGAQVLITTSARQLTVLMAVSCQTDVQVPYTTQDPQSYVDLVDSIEAGQSAIGTAVFSFPAGVDPSGGYVNWEFLDASGVVYATGNAFDYVIQSDGFSNIVFAKALINVPSSVPASDVNSKYQLKYTLTAPEVAGQQNVFFSYENVTVIGLTTTPTGTQDQVELKGNKATLSIVIPDLYDTVVVQLFQDNVMLGQTPIHDFTRVGSGYYYAGVFDTSQLVESLEPYLVIWNYSNSTAPSVVYTEQASLWIATPTMLSAVNDVKAKINKARTTLYGTPDLLFPVETIMLWLRRARDAFNGAGGNFTTFTMTNAKGIIREYWLNYAELFAIESQYMAEGEKAFDFGGAAITLNVDRTGYLDNMAGKLRGQLDNDMKPLKQNLIIKGNTGGDGSTDPSKLRAGAMGSVGITITPASPWGPFRSGLPYPTTNMF